jgi:hypothetical protein
LYGAFVWACKALDSPQRRFPAWADTPEKSAAAAAGVAAAPAALVPAPEAVMEVTVPALEAVMEVAVPGPGAAVVVEPAPSPVEFLVQHRRAETRPASPEAASPRAPWTSASRCPAVPAIPIALITAMRYSPSPSSRPGSGYSSASNGAESPTVRRLRRDAARLPPVEADGQLRDNLKELRQVMK